jgi:hypothetical protein
MRDLAALLTHLAITVLRLCRSGGVRAVMAESPLLRHRLLILTRGRQRAPNLHLFVKRLIGTLRREYLDQVPFWGAADLRRKQAEFQEFHNLHRARVSLDGERPARREPRKWAQLAGLVASSGKRDGHREQAPGKVAVGGVRGEPVSRVNSLLGRESTGNYAIWQRETGVSVPSAVAWCRLPRRFPGLGNRELRDVYQGSNWPDQGS